MYCILECTAKDRSSNDITRMLAWTSFMLAAAHTDSTQLLAGNYTIKGTAANSDAGAVSGNGR